MRNRFDIEDDSEVIDLVVTEFHVMLLYTDHVTILCTLNEKKLTDDFISSKFVNFVVFVYSLNQFSTCLFFVFIVSSYFQYFSYNMF